MMKNGGGRIVNISSRGAFRGEPTAPAYGASKAGMNSLGQSLAQLLAPHNIFIGTVAPGFVETDMAAERLSQRGGNAIRSQSPLNRVAKPERSRACRHVPGVGGRGIHHRRHRRRQRRLVFAQLSARRTAVMIERLDLQTARLHIRHFEEKDLDNCIRFRREVFGLDESPTVVETLADLDDRQLPRTGATRPARPMPTTQSNSTRLAFSSAQPASFRPLCLGPR